MGLLDDAIREHLELKRRRGADPSAVAREEREALEPVFPDEPEHDDADHAGAADGSDDGPHDAPVPAPAAREQPEHAGVHVAGEKPIELSGLGEETAELDMQAVMEADGQAGESAAPVGPIVEAPTPRADDHEPLSGAVADWGLDDDADDDADEGEPSPPHVPGQERLSFE